MDTMAGRPFWSLQFDEAGALTSPDRSGVVDEIARSGVTELFVVSHGWGNSHDSAQRLYAALMPMIETAAATTSLGPRGFAGVFWPSLWFPDPPAEASAEVAAAVADDKPGAAAAALTGAQIAAGMAGSFPPGQQATVAALGELIDAGQKGLGVDSDAVQQQRVEAFHQQLQTLLPAPALPAEDAGASAVVTSNDPGSAYATLATDLGTPVPGSDAQGLGDRFAKIWEGAKDALRVGSYWEMKARAGTIGERGLGPLLEALHAAAPTVRVHLVGHSFGGRLVAFTLSGISSAAASPVASLCLVQGAFSHYSFTEQAASPFGDAGALCGVADRVHGPLVSTWSTHDWAVGRWYPRASFIARQDAQSDSAVVPGMRWGGMGGDGFQAVPSLTPWTIKPAGEAYDLSTGGFHSVDASGVVADVSQSAFSGAHSDIRHPEVAWLVASAAAAH